MSSVYRAVDRTLERHVAIKLLHEHYAVDDDAVERFRREATSVAQVAHENIVTVIDRGTDGRRQFIVFELVDGPNLKELVRARGPLPVEEALTYAMQIGRALAFAHAQGLVHRDVKPQNVLLTPEGRAKVTDFGIARSLAVDGLTQTGTVLGTSEYVAPEQARGEQVGPATDIYALGVVLYELLAGEVPYGGESFVEIALRHLNDPVPSIRNRRPGVTWRLDSAVVRALAKRPEERFQSMEAMVTELETCRTEAASGMEGGVTQIVPPPPPAAASASASASASRVPRRKRPLWPLLAALLGLVLAAVVAMVFALRHNGGGSPAANAVVPKVQAVATYDPPPGDGREHDELIAAATDGNPATAWSTERYSAPLAMIGKKGVGLVLDAGAPTQPHQLVVRTDTPGFTMQVLAGDAKSGPFQPVSPEQTVGARAVFDLKSTGKHRYLVVWITKLAGPVAHVNEVSLA